MNSLKAALRGGGHIMEMSSFGRCPPEVRTLTLASVVPFVYSTSGKWSNYLFRNLIWSDLGVKQQLPSVGLELVQEERNGPSEAWWPCRSRNRKTERQHQRAWRRVEIMTWIRTACSSLINHLFAYF